MIRLLYESDRDDMFWFCKRLPGDERVYQSNRLKFKAYPVNGKPPMCWSPKSDREIILTGTGDSNDNKWKIIALFLNNGKIDCYTERTGLFFSSIEKAKDFVRDYVAPGFTTATPDSLSWKFVKMENPRADTQEVPFKLYDVVRYAGYDWYVIKLDADVAMLLAKNDEFGTSKYSNSSINHRYYSQSIIRKTIYNKVLPKLKANGARPLEFFPRTPLKDVVAIPSWKDVEIVPRSILSFPRKWVLNNTVTMDADVHVIFPDGDCDLGSDMGDYAIRPAMRVLVKDLTR